MVKIITRCTCTICTRTPRSDTGPSPPIQDDTFDNRKHRQPTASTSHAPYSTPLAITLPNEILLRIFHLARSSAPENGAWYAELSLVHSRWREAAQDCLARIVTIRHVAQLSMLERAVDARSIGARVEQLVVDISAVHGDEAIEQALPKLITAFQGTLEAIRVQGFGVELDTLIPPSLAASLSSLATIELSPIDQASLATSASVFDVLDRTKSLKNVFIHPKVQRIVHLDDVTRHDADVSFFISTLPVLVSIRHILETGGDRSDKLKDLFEFFDSLLDFVDPNAARLELLSLSCLSFSTKLFFSLVQNSVKTLTRLHFSSVVITDGGGGSRAELFSLLSLVLSGQLIDFKWEDPLFWIDGTLQSHLPKDAFWEFLSRCKKLQKLSLRSILVFDLAAETGSAASLANLFSPSVHPRAPSTRELFQLPVGLEELDIGSASEDVDLKQLGWWFKRIRNLVAPNPAVRRRSRREEREVQQEADDASDSEDEEDFHTSLIDLFASNDPVAISPPRHFLARADSLETKRPQFRHLTICLPSSCRPLIASKAFERSLSRMAKSIFDPGSTVNSKGLGRDRPQPSHSGAFERAKQDFSIRFGFLNVVEFDPLDLTRDLRMTM